MESEKNIERYLVKKMKSIGGKAYKFVSPGNAGVPDRVVIFPNGALIFAELKCETGEPSEVQKYQIGRLRELLQEVRVLYSKSDVDSLLKEFGGTE